jgi:hypothetical protein
LVRRYNHIPGLNSAYYRQSLLFFMPSVYSSCWWSNTFRPKTWEIIDNVNIPAPAPETVIHLPSACSFRRFVSPLLFAVRRDSDDELVQLMAGLFIFLRVPVHH